MVEAVYSKNSYLMKWNFYWNWTNQMGLKFFGKCSINLQEFLAIYFYYCLTRKVDEMNFLQRSRWEQNSEQKSRQLHLMTNRKIFSRAYLKVS